MQNSSSASLVISNIGSISEELTLDHFGTNILFHTDRVKSDSDFSQLIEFSGIVSIRYPGGTVSEQFFDPSDPNSNVGYNYFDIANGSSEANAGRRDILPLSSYLDFIEQIDGVVTIVFPTFRYFDEDTRRIKNDAEAEIREFIVDLLSGVYGAFNGGNISIGNEWYQTNFDWDAGEFGRLQSDIARIISEAAQSLDMRETISILGQGGRNASQNETMARFFDHADAAHIDGVISHIYGTNSNGNALGIGGSIQGRLDDMMQIWEETVGENLQLAITEWNVGESGEETTQINGLMRSAPLLRMFAEMVQSDVDIAHIWSMQTRGPAGLSGREGTGADWSPTGYLYNMLFDGGVGAELIDTGSHFRLRDQSGEIIGYNYTFASEDEANIFLSSGVAQDHAISIDLSQIVQEANYVYATILTNAPGYSRTGYTTEAALRFITDLPTDEDLNIELGAYETIQITVGYNDGMDLRADNQVAINDQLIGSSHDDQIDGGMGNDTLQGQNGRDWLFGGEGNDIISGGTDNDTLEGGSGNDTLLGEHGRDILLGGDGEDWINGGAWHDTIHGGNGSDNLEGGTGNDSIEGAAGDDTLDGGDGNDTVDGGAGADVLIGGAGEDIIIAGRYESAVIGGAGRDTLVFRDLEDGVSIWTADGIIEIGNSQFVYEEIEVIQGTEYADQLTLMTSDGAFDLGAGIDNLTIFDGGNNTVEMGSGDDLVFDYGGRGNQVFGGAGNDTLFVSSDSGTYAGGLGNDEFYFFGQGSRTITYSPGDGEDLVSGFDTQRDQIVLDQSLKDQMSIAFRDEGTVINFSDGGSITILGDNMSATDVFEFV